MSVQQCPSLCSAGMYAPGNNTDILAAMGPTPHTATLVSPIRAERFYRHYRVQPALLNRHYRRTTMGAPLSTVQTADVRLHVLEMYTSVEVQ